MASVLIADALPARAAPDRVVNTSPPVRRSDDRAAFGLLPHSRLGGRTHDVLGSYVSACPHTREPNPIVLILLDPATPASDREIVAERFARHGYVGVVAPALTTATQIGAAIDALRGDAAATPDEPGCRGDGRVALFGTERGAALALHVAAERDAAGHPLALVISVLAAGTRPLAIPATTPTVLIEGRHLEHGGAKLVVIEDLTPCEIPSYNPCLDRLRAGKTPDGATALVNAAIARHNLLVRTIAELARGLLDHDPEARARFTKPVEVRRVPSPAHSRPRTHVLFDLPLVFGLTFADDATSGAIVLRPELLVARAHGGVTTPTRALAIGIYVEGGSVQRERELGGGLTAAVIAGRFGVAPSFGMIRRDAATGFAASAFLGLRDVDDVPPYDLATGLRLDVRSLSGATTVTASLQVDLLLLKVAIQAINGGLPGGRR